MGTEHIHKLIKDQGQASPVFQMFAHLSLIFSEHCLAIKYEYI